LESYFYSDCSNFDFDDFSYCVTTYVEGETATCKISISGEDCNSCVVEAGEDEYCFIFDCQNTVLRATGSSCEPYIFLGPLQQEVKYAHLPCPEGCSICDEGEFIGNRGETFTLESGDELSCDYLQLYALIGLFDTDYCGTLNSLASDLCGCGTESGPTTSRPVGTEPPTDYEFSFFSFVKDEICAENSKYYSCSICEVDDANATSSFNCTTVDSKCKDIYSFCPEPLSFCHSLIIEGSTSDAESYDYKKCNYASIKPYEFSYCVEYEVSPDAKRCEMKVNDITCKSCSLSRNDGEVYYYADYDCTNTVLGRLGSMRTAKLVDETEEYFIYKSLPCPGGCNLCGDDGIMEKREATFTHDDTVKICFQAQFDALVGPTEADDCAVLRKLVEDDCRCKGAPVPAPSPDSNPDESPPPTTAASRVPSHFVPTIGTFVLLGLFVASSAIW